jgi:hypothetical protein
MFSITIGKAITCKRLDMHAKQLSEIFIKLEDFEKSINEKFVNLKAPQPRDLILSCNIS